MKDEDKTKEQILEELVQLRERINQLEALETERIQAEEALRESEERYRLLFNSGNDAVFVHQPKAEGIPQEFIEVNDVACHRYGYTREEFLGLTPLNLSAPERADYVPTRLKKLFAEKHILFETIHLTKDGRRIPVEISAHLFDFKGKPTVLSIVRDITQRKLAEEALREREETLKAILAASPVGIGLVRNRILDWSNKAMYRIWGYEEGSLLGESAEILYPDAEEYKRVGREFYSGIEEGGIGHVETRWVTKDGGVIDCYVQGSSLDPSDLSKGVIVTAMDITGRKRAEEKIRESEEKYRSLVDNIAIGVSLISPNMEILTLNSQMKDWFPHIDPKKRPLCYRSFNNPPREEVCSYCPTILTLQDGEVHEAVTDTPSGNKIRNYRIISSPVKDSEGKVVAAIESVEDITERKRAQEQLLTYQKQLRSLASELVLTEERQRRRLATDLHDSIAQLLGISKLKLDALRSGALAGAVAPDLDEARELTAQAIQQSRSLIFELSPPILYQFGLEAALESLVERMRQQHGIHIEFTDNKRPKPLSEDLAVLLFRAVQELLVNVVKHARTGNARMSIVTDDGEVHITVEDDGVGFDISEIDSHMYGVGKFGLFSIRERLQHLGGGFKIISEPDMGTQVTLVAPCRERPGRS